MRAFVAIFPPPEVRAAAAAGAREAIRRLDRRLADLVHWTGPENIHLTLKFLDNRVREETLGNLRLILADTCAGHVPFDVLLLGLGAFPSARRTRILWAGVGAGSDKLRTLAADLDDALSPLGFGREERPYTPHLTVGRARNRPVSLDLQRTKLAAQELEFRVTQIKLVRSRLKPREASYEVIEAFALGEEGSPSKRPREVR